MSVSDGMVVYITLLSDECSQVFLPLHSPLQLMLLPEEGGKQDSKQGSASMEVPDLIWAGVIPETFRGSSFFIFQIHWGDYFYFNLCSCTPAVPHNWLAPEPH